jgi:protein-disulfide isomerase
MTFQISVAAGLFACGLAASAAAQEKSAFSDAERKEIKGLVRAYLLENPEIINEMVELLQEKQDAERERKQREVIAKHRDEIFNPPEATVIGNVKGDVTVVEFFDYNCGYCKSMFPAVMETLAEDGKIRLVIKELPILGPASEVAAKAALASRKQGKYSEYHQALLSHKGSLTDGPIMAIAERVGLDVAQLKKDMDDRSIRDIIERNRDLARDLQINGTPAVFVGEAFFPGAISKENLKLAIDEARK